MREIKFRYRIRNRKYGKIHKIIIDINVLENGRQSQYFNILDYEILSRDEYTELKDKNGNEIYEGDILEDIDRIGIIEFYQGGFIVQDIRPLPDESATYYHIDILGEDAEIIGNIYENSELMS